MSVNELVQRKAELRQFYKQLRKNLTAEKRRELDSAISNKLLQNHAYINSDTIFAFVSKDIEVNTRGIIEQALKDGKNVAVPRCISNTQMDYYYIKSFDDLKAGAYHIMEPDTSKCEKACNFRSGLCIVPGLVYDKKGYRLGFGKGYYDRFLINFKGISVGICYSMCIEKELPRGIHDKPVNLVITDSSIIDNRCL